MGDGINRVHGYRNLPARQLGQWVSQHPHGGFGPVVLGLAFRVGMNEVEPELPLRVGAAGRGRARLRPGEDRVGVQSDIKQPEMLRIPSVSRCCSPSARLPSAANAPWLMPARMI